MQTVLLKTIVDEMFFQTPAGEVAIPEVTRVKCDDCGEEFFDHEANKVLDQYRGRSNKKLRKIKAI